MGRFRDSVEVLGSIDGLSAVPDVLVDQSIATYRLGFTTALSHVVDLVNADDDAGIPLSLQRFIAHVEHLRTKPIPLPEEIT